MTSIESAVRHNGRHKARMRRTAPSYLQNAGVGQSHAGKECAVLVVLSGKGVCGGIAVGRLAFYKRRGRQSYTKRRAEDPEEELRRFDEARKTADTQLVALYERALRQVDRADAQIFQIHRMLLKDPDLVESVNEIIAAEKVMAESAVEKVSERFVNMFLSLDNTYMQGRAADMKDVGDRLLDILSGTQPSCCSPETPVIIAADDLVPSETIQLNRSKILAFVTMRGSSTSHTAILASTMGIPAVVAVGDKIGPEDDGKQAAVDGFCGRIYIEPDQDTMNMLIEKRERALEQRSQLQSYRGLPSVTRDGQKIKVLANIGGIADIDAAIESDAEGVGLLRSEFLYLERSGCPSQEEQFAAYSTVARRMEGKKVVIRTLDIGADKRADYLNMPFEDNPSLGCRGIRLCLKRPELFRTQLRAIYRASAYGNISILFPMITTLEEVRRVHVLADEVKGELDAQMIPYDKHLPLGIMIETPAAAIMSDRLAEEVDFFSIGTNDLTQYTMATDRQNAIPGTPLDDCNPAVLRLIEMVVKNAHKNHIPVCICGELAGSLMLTATFLDYGVDELSVSPARVLSVRRRVRDL